MNIELSALEARVIGCLIEKQITTPDQYPLSLNALTNACNQKSNRDPVLDLNDRAVQQVVEGLVRKHFVIERSGFGSRVTKYQQVFCNTEFGSLKFSPIETALLCELLLRGAQTPGELKGRASRMSEMSDPGQVDEALASLTHRPDGPYVVRLAREPDRRDSRYMHLFSGAVADVPSDAEPETTVSAAHTPIDEDRLSRLELLVESLCKEIDSLKSQINKR